MAKALQECPNSVSLAPSLRLLFLLAQRACPFMLFPSLTQGLLLADEILTCTRAQQKSKSAEALRRCDNDPLVITAVARLFQQDRKKAEKARKWFGRYAPTISMLPLSIRPCIFLPFRLSRRPP